MLAFIKRFLHLEAASGIVLMAVAAMAMLVANSPLATHYGVFLKINIAGISLDHWINDGLMSVFFLLVGLEIKREFLEGELSTRQQSLLPLLAALGGVALPAAIYLYFNAPYPSARGWAIPSATDIAFSLGVLALFGDKIRHSLKIFLMAVAVIDDLIAVLIIALFYTENIVPEALGAAALCCAALFLCGRRNVGKMWPYLLIGLVLWFAVLTSGVHATVAGVLLGALMPVSLGKQLIEKLHGWVAYGVVPIFAFANAGVPLSGISMETMTHPITLGILAGLFIGKQLGIFAVIWLAVRFRLARLPDGSSWMEIYAVCMLAGIGFTMSLFIGALAFADEASLVLVRLGVLSGSLLSALIGALLMSLAIRRKNMPISR